MSQATRIIGLTGRRKSGKSLAAARLAEAHGYARMPFAGPLKDMLRAIGLGDEELDGRLKEEPCALLLGRTPRHAMQTLGTDWARNLIDPGLWLNLWEKRAAGRGLVVAEDVRFRNEACLIRQLGGAVVRISRSFQSRTGDLLTAPAAARPLDAISSHPSETDHDYIECDLTIRNDGTVEDLHRAVDRFVLSG